MRFYLPTLFLLASAVCNALDQATTATTTAAPKKCYTLNDPKAPFFSPTTKSIVDDQVLAMLILQGIGKQVPALSKCLASSDPVTSLLPVYIAKDSQTCLKVLMGQNSGSEMTDGSSDASTSRRLEMNQMDEWMKKFMVMFNGKPPKDDGSGSLETGSGESIDDMMEIGTNFFPKWDEMWAGGMMKVPGGKKGNSTVMTEEQKTMFATTLCPLIDSTVMPCVNSLLVPALESIIKAGGTCCADFKTLIKEWTGSDLPTFMTKMSTAMQAAACSKNSKTGVVCGDAWTVYLYELENSIQEMDSMMNDRNTSAIEEMIQLPNSEVCNAMTGKSFKITTGEKCTNKVTSTVDICYEPFDKLMTEIASLPAIEKMNLTSVFADGECLDTEKMHKNLNATMDKNATDEQSFMKMIMKDFPMKKEDHKPKKMCLHIPNSVDSCKFASTLSTDDSGSGIVDANIPEDDSAAISAVLTHNLVLFITTLVSVIVVFA